MGVDYVARKSAKKRKKRERQAVGKDGGAQRERRRKKIRRLCQGACYKAPELTEEDKRWSDREDDAVNAQDNDVEEAAARAKSHRGASTSGVAVEGRNADAYMTPVRKAKHNEKKNVLTKRERGQASDIDNDTAGRPTLSTSVQLLDASVLAQNARQAALKKLAPGAKADALERFPPLLQACMLTMHHVEPTPVQEKSWPLALEGRDVQGVAEPGSGKTLAYLLPGFVKLQAEGHVATSQPEGPPMLVLLPTRELAQQVAALCRATRAVTGLRTVCVVGGAQREEQVALLSSKQPHVLVATPGRLLDLVDGGELKLQGQVRYVVLDEADKMLSLGFKPHLDRLYDMLLRPYGDSASSSTEAIVKGRKKVKAKEAQPSSAAAGAACSGSRDGITTGRPQVLLFSATMPETVTSAAGQWLRRPEMVSVSAGGAHAISRTVTQVVQVCAEHKKPEKLLKHLSRVRESIPAGCRNSPRVLVFANRIKTVRFLAALLRKEGYKVAQLHGQRSQAERNQAVSDFRSGKAQVMVATDVAARGLDIRALPYVVNYDFPARLETYIHRVGRTGRIAAYGHAYSFFTRNLAPLAPPLLELVQAHGQAVDPNLAALAAAWKVAEEKLGDKSAAAAVARVRNEAEEDGDDGSDADDEGDGVETGEGLSLAEEVLLAAEDLMEGLGPQDARAISTLIKKKLVREQQQQQVNGKMKSQQPSKAGGGDNGSEDLRLEEIKVATEGSMRGRGRRGDELLVPVSRVKPQDQQGLGQTKQAGFVAAKTFKGAMSGYAFKKGPQGLGYYLDQRQQGAGRRPKASAVGAVLESAAGVVSGNHVKGNAGSVEVAQAVAASGKAGSVKATKGAAAKASSTAWGLPTRNKPIIPVRHSDFLSDSDSDGFSGDDPGVADLGWEPEDPHALGKVAIGKRGRGSNNPAVAAGNADLPEDFGLGSDDSEDVPSGGQRAIAKRRYKALPGRLRKKIKGQCQQQRATSVKGGR